MHFWPYVLQDWNLNKKLSAHLFEVRSWITLASLHSLCVPLLIMSLSVCVCVAWCLPFLFSHTIVFIARAREMWSVLLVFIRLLYSVFLPGCSSLSVSSPLNYYVCAHSSVTLNPGFSLLSDGWHRKHVFWYDVWQAMTLCVGKYNYRSDIKKGYLLMYFWSPGYLHSDCKLFCFDAENTKNSGG